MRKYKGYYQSMTAYYELGTVYAESQEEAEREIRARQTCFTPGEKTLIRCREAKD